MVIYKTDEEIELIRKSCLLVCKTLAHVGSMLKPGITGTEIDREAETFIHDHGAKPVFKGYNGFPSTLCVSVNEAVVHGIPKDKPFENGDVVSIDCGVFMNNFCGDAAYTFPIGDVDDRIMHLLKVTKTSLHRGIDKARVGNRMGDIGFAIQYYCERKHKYSIVRELVGHGIGQNMHESPEVPNYGKRSKGIRLRDGLTIAIEPMVNLGKKEVMQANDGWTILAKDRLPSAHYEHTIAIRKDGPDILSDHKIIERAIKKNDYLRSVPMFKEKAAIKS